MADKAGCWLKIALQSGIELLKTALAIHVMFRNLTPLFKDASVAQLVEHHLAKVNVEGSNPFARSNLSSSFSIT